MPANNLIHGNIKMHPGKEALVQWVNDLTKAKISQKMENWPLAGRASLIINPNSEYVSSALREVCEDAGFKFLNLKLSDIKSNSKDENILNDYPHFVYVESGDWLAAESEKQDPDSLSEYAEIRKFLIDKISKFSPEQPVFYATSIADLGSAHKDVKKVGGFERFLAISEESFESIGQRFVDLVGKDICSDQFASSLGKLGKLVDSNFQSSDEKSLAALCLRRVASMNDRPLDFLDLVHIATHDLIEEGQVIESNKDSKRQTAYHEAGHSVASMLETDGLNIPDYTSILPGASGFEGVSVSSYEYQLNRSKDNQTTYQQFRTRIRILLAGRAGEEIAVGVSQISDGASSDLEQATRYASRFFAKCGFAPQMDQPGKSGANLYVIIQPVSDSEQAQLEVLVREFLQEEYNSIFKILVDNIKLMDTVAERLLHDPIVDQSELSSIYIDYQSHP